jgi:hypothetical protein
VDARLHGVDGTRCLEAEVGVWGRLNSRGDRGVWRHHNKGWVENGMTGFEGRDL